MNALLVVSFCIWERGTIQVPSARQAAWFQAFLVLNYTGPMESYNLKTYAIKGYVLSMALVF